MIFLRGPCEQVRALEWSPDGRRIVCFVREGDTIAAGERVGFIRFGSRVDVYLPAGVRPLVAPGQMALGGETVIADIGHRYPKRAFRVG